MVGPVSVPEAATEECSQLPSCILFWPSQRELRVTLSLLLVCVPRQEESQNGDDQTSQHPCVAFVGGKMSFGDLFLAICLHCLRQEGFQVEGLNGSEGQ